MNSTTPFQFLPPHVVQLIVNHIVGNFRLVYDKVVVNSREHIILLRPLLWVCRNFCAISLPLCCSNITLDINYVETDSDSDDSESIRGDVDHCPPPYVDSPNDYVGHHTHHLARHLFIDVGEESIYSGAAVSVLQSPTYCDTTFPLARKLSVHIDMEQLEEDYELYDFDDSDEGNTSEETTENSTPISAEVEANIVSFILRIKQMAPMIDRILVKPRNSGDSRQISCPNLNYLVSQLCRLSQSIEYRIHGEAHVPVVFQLDGIRDLVDIKYASVRGASKFMQLAQKSAQTLRSLKLHTFLCRGAADLIEDNSGGYVTYPHLISLTLFHATCISDKEEPTFEGAVPFPALKSLCTINSYPFGDDTPFRGNKATLESLTIHLGDFAVSILRKHNVFTPTSHPKLRHVTTTLKGYDWHDEAAGSAAAVKFALGIGTRATVRSIDNPRSGSALTQAISSLSDHTCIQVLEVPLVSLELWDFFAIIKSLPLLSDLAVSSAGLGALPTGVTPEELPAYIVSTFAPMGKRFKCWHIESFRHLGYAEDAKYALLLALACPNFTWVSRLSSHRKLFTEHLVAGIASDMFKDYALRLQRLLLQV
ncbi:hypothetical protein GGI19_003040 [Coemansia pectinata]|uniref:Uncharacterized protein n=1 Tax=Coemansia pectinata TaxID=1052879 RepID=A0A9W8LAP7_9FUNG|nr:hypothetical protein GGI19_003040 [Coemansia pectinata]